MGFALFTTTAYPPDPHCAAAQTHNPSASRLSLSIFIVNLSVLCLPNSLEGECHLRFEAILRRSITQINPVVLEFQTGVFKEVHSYPNGRPLIAPLE